MVLKEHKVYAKNTWNKILKDSYKGVHKILTVGETYLLYADIYIR